jgi:hypothetical protein
MRAEILKINLSCLEKQKPDLAISDDEHRNKQTNPASWAAETISRVKSIQKKEI